jgi:hypothetical protein
LVDENDVAVALDLTKGAAHWDVAFGGGLAGAARQKKERVRLRCAADGGNHRHPEIDRASVRMGAIFWDSKRPAFGRNPRGEPGCFQLAGGELDRALVTTGLLTRTTGGEEAETKRPASQR